MKECKYCRTKYDDNLAACPNCGGTKVVTAEEIAEEAAIKRREIEYREKANAAPEIHKKRLIGILAAVVVVIISIIAVISINANKPLSNGMTKDEGEEVLAAGIAYLDNGDYEAAIDCFLQLPPDSKQYSEAQSLLTQSKDSYRSEIVDRVNAHIAKGEYDSAFNLISKAQELLPDDSELKSAYDDVYTAYRSSVLEQVDSYVSNGQYELALEYLTGVQAKFPTDAALQDSYSTTQSAYYAVVRTEAIEQADAYVADNDYANAIKTVNAALGKIGQDDELDAKLTIYVNEYVSTVTSTAQAQYKKYNAESIYAAEEIITNALDVLPGNQDLTSALDYYQELEPIRIVTMPMADTGPNGGTFSVIESAKDNTGNKYSDVMFVERFAFDATEDNRSAADYGKRWWYCYKTIDLDYKYSKITGVLFQSEEYASASTQTRIDIQGFSNEEPSISGGYSLWAGQVSAGADPNYFEIDVTGKKYILIEFKGDHSAGRENEAYHYAYVAQLYLWK